MFRVDCVSFFEFENLIFYSWNSGVLHLHSVFISIYVLYQQSPLDCKANTVLASAVPECLKNAGSNTPTRMHRPVAGGPSVPCCRRRRETCTPLAAAPVPASIGSTPIKATNSCGYHACRTLCLKLCKSGKELEEEGFDCGSNVVSFWISLFLMCTFWTILFRCFNIVNHREPCKLFLTIFFL